MTQIISQTISYSNLTYTLKNWFRRSPARQIQISFILKQFLGKEKLPPKKINLISPAVIEKFNQRQL